MNAINDNLKKEMQLILTNPVNSKITETPINNNGINELNLNSDSNKKRFNYDKEGTMEFIEDEISPTFKVKWAGNYDLSEIINKNPLLYNKGGSIFGNTSENKSIETLYFQNGRHLVSADQINNFNLVK